MPTIDYSKVDELRALAKKSDLAFDLIILIYCLTLDDCPNPYEFNSSRIDPELKDKLSAVMLAAEFALHDVGLDNG